MCGRLLFEGIALNLVLVDPVFGPYRLTEEENELLGCSSVQRLHNIKQLGFSYLMYPGATHSKFSHTVGVLRLAREAIRLLSLKPEHERILRAFAILHCIGHGPLAWASEKFFERNSGLGIGERTVSIVKEDEEILEVLAKKWSLSATEMDLLLKSMERSERFQISPEYLEELGYLLLRLEFLARDAYYTGVSGGAIDAFRVLHSVKIDSKSNHLLFDLTEQSIVESVYTSFYLMYLHVYTRHPRPVYDSMFAKALEIALEKRIAENSPQLKFMDSFLFGLGKDKNPKRFLALVDDYILMSLGTCGMKDVENIVQRIILARPYTRIREILLDASQRERCLRHKAHLKDVEERLLSKLGSIGVGRDSVILLSPSMEISQSVFTAKIRDVLIRDEVGRTHKLADKSPLIEPFDKLVQRNTVEVYAAKPLPEDISAKIAKIVSELV